MPWSSSLREVAWWFRRVIGALISVKIIDLAVPSSRRSAILRRTQRSGGQPRVTSSQQQQAFRQALAHARQERGWSQRELARAIGLSQSAVSYWEQGKSLPEPFNVVELERVLELESGTLARLLGYMPAATMRREMATVLDAIMADPELGERERELLLTMYRELVRQRRGDREPREASTRNPRRDKTKDRG